MLEDDELEQDDGLVASKPVSRKKLMILILPVVIVVGLSVGIYFALNRDYGTPETSYNVVKKTGEEDSYTVFYDLPEVKSALNSKSKEIISLSLNVELSKVEDVSTLEILSPRIKDAILAHVVELTPEEIESANGLYWLKEELLYRLNLVVSPIKIENLSVKNIEILNNEEK